MIQETREVKERKDFFGHFTEIVGWLQIVSSPLLAALLISAVFYFSKPSAPRLVVAIIIILTGPIIGIVFATRASKKRGTIHFISQVAATPEIENADHEKAP